MIKFFPRWYLVLPSTLLLLAACAQQSSGLSVSTVPTVPAALAPVQSPNDDRQYRKSVV